jgi:hypothetical protein
MVLEELETVLKTSKAFLLGTWVADAEGWGETDEVSNNSNMSQTKNKELVV